MSTLSSAVPTAPLAASSVSGSATARRGRVGNGQAAAGSGGFAAMLDPGAEQPATARPGKMVERSEADVRAAIHKSAGEFEALCLGQMIGFLWQDVEVDPNFGGGHGEAMFRELLTPEYGRMAAKQDGAGIAGAVEREMLRVQGLEPLSARGGH